VVYNTLHTAAGEQYSITLSDGTKVWLNAATSLRFPTHFAGNERRVEINGEAYFEVAKNKPKPFRVVARNMVVEVLGTHFNVNAYDNEAAIKTTLLEGSVKVVNRESPTSRGGLSIVNNTSVTIVPGKQAILTHDSRLTTADADVEEVMAWKNGSFSFNNADITTVMRQLERWYNIEVVYKGTKPSYLFSGGIPRNATLMEVMRILEVSKVRFQLQGRQLIVLP
jgi:transmembrane sensor